MKNVGILKIDQFHDHDSTEDFYVNTLQDHLETRHKDIALPHKHNFYLAVLFTKGTGTHEVDFTSYAVQPGALFFLSPGQTHHWELSKDTDGYIFFHTQPFYDLHYTHNKISHFPFFYSMHTLPCMYPGHTSLKKISLLFAMLLQENNSHQVLKKQAILSLVDLIYTESARAYTPQKTAVTTMQDNYYDKFRGLEELVEKHYTAEKSPSAYAGMLSISAKHLNRITQAVVGKTAGDVILDRILLEAKKALIAQRNSFSEIAFSLGYDDYAYFSRLFKKKTGETPSAFLARYRKG
jgi:AraC family transcriptional activator of pobA